MNPVSSSPDIFVIGGGPAGLAIAIFAAQAGMRVAVADHRRLPLDKACGEGLMPDTLKLLQTLGVSMRESGGVPFQGIRFNDADGKTSAAASFTKGFGLGIRRTALHARLVQRAVALGVPLLWGSRVALEQGGRASCDGRPVRCKYLIGADGEGSPVRKWAGLEKVRYEHIRFGARVHFLIRPWTDSVEVYWAPRCQIVVAPVAPDELCVAVTSRDSRLRFDDAVREVPALASRLRGACPSDPLRGARTALRRLKRVCRDRIALTGDASGSVDPLTGEGIGLAFRQASALVGAIRRDNLLSYQNAHDHIGRVPHLLSRIMLSMDARPRLRSRALRALAVDPSLLWCLLNLQVGESSVSSAAFASAIRFGWFLIKPSEKLTAESEPLRGIEG